MKFLCLCLISKIETYLVALCKHSKNPSEVNKYCDITPP